jgi:hypothetical protein
VPFTSFVMDETAIGSLAGKDRSPASSSSASVRFSTSSEAIGLAVRSFHAMDETAIGSLAGKDRSLASSSSASVRFSTSSEAIGLAVRSFHAACSGETSFGVTATGESPGDEEGMDGGVT